MSKVTDAETSTAGFKDGTNTDDDYGYDTNGNMITDKNKGITAISYNHLNLPVKITFDNSSTKKIEYLYNATGIKVNKKVTDGNVITTTDYLNGYQYINSVLQFFPTAEGYVKNTPVSGSNSYGYVYNYTDHLGNVRLSYIKQNNVLTILEENNYYPFGLKHNGYNYTADTTNKYKYNGKELQDELGLNLYDFGNRNYDAAIGRFHNMDRFAEKYYNLNPYQYGANNPVIFNDIKGDSLWISIGKNDRVLYENGNLLSKGSDGKFSQYRGNKAKFDKNGNVVGYKGFLGETKNALDKIRNGGSQGEELISSLENSLNDVEIHQDVDNSHRAGLVKWNSSGTEGGPNQKGNNYRESFVGLAHELGHAYDYQDGIVNRSVIGMIGGKSITGAEYEAMDWENRIRSEHGMILRTHYGNDANNNVIGPAYMTIGQTISTIRVNTSTIYKIGDFKLTSQTSPTVIIVK